MYKRGFHQAIPSELNASKEFEQIISVINQFQKGVSDQVKKKKGKSYNFRMSSTVLYKQLHNM